ncbi:MAG: hypothetical protein Q7S19_02125 [bacterium]|nr:hypothetical protein [bacterium]
MPFLTKNVAFSVLAGTSIMAGAFWMRYTGSAPQVVAQVESPIADTDADIAVASASGLTAEESTALQFIRTPSPSTLAYDELEDKSSLYLNSGLTYNTKDLTSKTATNRASLLSYGTNLAKTLHGFPFYTKRSPAEIAFDIYSNKDKGDTGLTELEATALAYQSASKSLLVQNVPSDLQTLHLRLINSFDRASQLIKNMEGVTTDKLLGLNSARQYVEEEKFALITLGQLNAYFKDKNVALGEKDKLKLSVAIYK